MRILPQPWLLFGYQNSPLSYAPVPLISTALLMRIALMSAADGVNPSTPTWRPVG